MSQNQIQLPSEVESLRQEIIYWIENYLPQMHLKNFIYDGEKYDYRTIQREFRLLCMQFINILKPFNLDPRQRLVIFFGSKCSECNSTDDLELHHINNDGKLDRETFRCCQVYIWKYYLIHLDEAYDTFELLCRDCHRGDSGFGIFTGLFRELGL